MGLVPFEQVFLLPTQVGDTVCANAVGNGFMRCCEFEHFTYWDGFMERLLRTSYWRHSFFEIALLFRLFSCPRYVRKIVQWLNLCGVISYMVFTCICFISLTAVFLNGSIETQSWICSIIVCTQCGVYAQDQAQPAHFYRVDIYF